MRASTRLAVVSNHFDASADASAPSIRNEPCAVVSKASELHQNALSVRPNPQTLRLHPSQVIVIGSGLAGLCTAIEALEHGAVVTILEKTKSLGGNSAKATSGINGIQTSTQEKNSINDSVETFVRDVLQSGGSSDAELAFRAGKEGRTAIEWLNSFGVELDDVCQTGGHSVPRTHRPRPDPKVASALGWQIIQALVNFLSSVPANRLTIVMGARAQRLLTQPMNTMKRFSVTESKHTMDHVCGVEYVDCDGAVRQVYGDAVVIATGGFAADADHPQSFLKKFTPSLARMATTNGPFATGDGLRLATALKGMEPSLVDMDKVQLHPTGFVKPIEPTHTPKWLAPESLRAVGGLLLDASGRRFCNELGYRDYVSKRILESGFPYKRNVPPAEIDRAPISAYLILNRQMIAAFGLGAYNWYLSKHGLFTEYKNIAEFAAACNFPEANLLATLNEYQAAAENGKDEFGKNVFPNSSWNPSEGLSVCVVTPCLHYTMGGLRVNSVAEVQSVTGSHFDSSTSIPGLFACGEVTGGLHGRNRLAGNSLLECVVFGRIAGKRAAQCNQLHVQALSPTEFLALPLRSKLAVGSGTYIYRFDLPSSKQALGYGPAQYLAVRANIQGKLETRFYSPISRYDDLGHVDLLIKVGQSNVVKLSEAKHMTEYIDNLQPGDTLEFAGPFGTLHLDLHRPIPGRWVTAGELKPKTKLGMIAGGVGISPMLQLIRSIMFLNRDDVQATLLYAAENEEDLLFKDKLLLIMQRHPNIKCHFILHHPPSSSAQKQRGFQYLSGFITNDVIRQYMFPPAADVQVVVCGPWKMCQVMKKQLEQLGYTKDLYHSFM